MTEGLLPTDEPIQLIDPAGSRTVTTTFDLPDRETLTALYRAMVSGRRFDAQVTALTRQGRLAVYPSSRGQEACQTGTALALRPQDWLFPTYRDSVAVVTRGIDPMDVLVSFRGDWHCGYDPRQHRTAPQCTPLATNTLHAVGLAHAARLKNEDTVAVVLLGDGATSEGDTHEALNFAAVWKAPVVFVVQNNGYAISVPLHRQTAAPSLAHKGIGYGIRSFRVDGNDAAAVYATVSAAVSAAAAGAGPVLIEAVTYRMEAHTNADDATRYRQDDEVAHWLERDPLRRLATFLGLKGSEFDDEAELLAADVRTRAGTDASPSPESLFEHVYAERPVMLERQMVDALDLPAGGRSGVEGLEEDGRGTR
ncbi:thiamine pyrophosphate-dependent enzyme [Kineosporia succinea]|uniref:2-oxoisovalerate dehydrogenase subunit alpha n=1 Tax=Kineosporia succinea TaxID=84632 RepID=A0ABT9P9W2_9ACTN|nr:thiamine pyrophosphate-dependent enzyme [Kineosporia succinea]MDP9829199.1 pyruvate dehydrogenase E1 component alpha subunit [Kineosporia succinea]